MSPTDINKRREIIYSYIEKKQLKSAIENVKQLTDIQHNWSVSEKLTELETNYKFMLHYLVEGKGDPQQDKIYDKLFRDIYILTDEAAESLLMQESSSVFYEKLRVQNVREAVTLDDYIDILIKHADTATFLDLLEEDEEKAAEKTKGIKIATTTIETLTGAATALASAMTLGPIAGPIIGGVNAAAVVASGVANIAKIKATPTNGSQSSLPSATSGASVSAPNIPTQLDSVRNITTATEEDRLNRMSNPQKVYILQSDIEAAGQQSRVQVNESSF